MSDQPVNFKNNRKKECQVCNWTDAVGHVCTAAVIIAIFYFVTTCIRVN